MKYFVFGALLLASVPLEAQQATSTTTYIAGVSGTANCTYVNLTVRRTVQSDGTSQTTLQYAVKDCEPGSTTPTRLIANNYAVVPDTAYTLDRAGGGSSLNYQAAEGSISIRWTPTKDQHNTYSATWNWGTPEATRKDTENTDTKSASVVGILLGRLADGRQGYVSIDQGTSVTK